MEKLKKQNWISMGICLATSGNVKEVSNSNFYNQYIQAIPFLCIKEIPPFLSLCLYFTPKPLTQLLLNKGFHIVHFNQGSKLP